MPNRASPQVPNPSTPRVHRFRNYLIGLAATLLVIVVVVVTYIALHHRERAVTSNRLQASLAPFYVPPAGWQAASPGTVFRTQPLAGVPSGGRGWRVLYRTQRANGAAAVSSGMVFVPGPGAPVAPPTGRDVVAWAHPTTGLGDQCAPSRTADVESDVQGLGSFLQAGWVVTATDYAGLGTPGIEQYLIGKAEANDVLNSVRAAQRMPEVDAGSDVALWGHSQGGQSVLWTIHYAPTYAPEIHIVAAAVAAPAAELPILFSHQWNTLVGSLIGSEVLLSWPATYPGLSTSGISRASVGTLQGTADQCIKQGGEDLLVKSKLGGEPFFDKDPLTSAAWTRQFEANSPPPPTVPTLLVQGTQDTVVLPGSNVTYLDEACAAGSQVTGDFIGNLGHFEAGKAGAPFAFTWFQQRFAGLPSDSTCGTLSPVPALGVT
ncbi:MAG: lipase family protein [Acidimicrobiales bacterium]